MIGLKIFAKVQTFRRRPFVPSHNFCHPAPSCYPQLQQEIAWPNSPQQFKQMLYLSPKPVITGSPCCSSQLLSSLCLSCHHPPRRHHHHQDACSKMWNISRILNTDKCRSILPSCHHPPLRHHHQQKLV